jgi:hypothetical protein
MLLITGSVHYAERARAKARHARDLALSTICPGCGDPITADDETIDGMHSQCAEAGAEVGYADCGLW